MDAPAVPPPPKPPPSGSSVPPPPTIDEVKSRIPKGLLYKEGKGGLMVLAAPHGVIVAQFDEKGIQRRFSGPAKQWVQQVLPQMYPGVSSAARPVFGREGERERLTIGMRSRLKVAIERGDQTAALESLDPDKSRKIPTDPSAISPDRHKELPRHLTWVTLDPPPPRRHIAISEKQIPVEGKPRRPDEVFVSYDLSDDELKRVTKEVTENGVTRRVADPNFTSFADLDEVDAKNLRIHIGDPNLEISEGAAKEHFTKTNKYLVAVLEQLTNPNGPKPTIKPIGRVYLSARDVYMSPAMLKLGSFGAQAVRWVKDLSEFAQSKGLGGQAPQTQDNSVIHASVVLEKSGPAGWQVAVDDGVDAVRSGVSGKLGKSGLKQVVDAVISPGMIDAAINILQTHVK